MTTKRLQRLSLEIIGSEYKNTNSVLIRNEDNF